MMKNIMNKFIIKKYQLKYLIFSIISGILLALSFQKFNFFFLAWIAFIPLIYSIYKSGLIYSGLCGAVAGIAYSLIAFNWMYVFMLVNTKSVKAALIVAILFWLYQTIYFVLWSLIINIIKNYKKIITTIFAAGLWIVFEYIKNYFLSGFPINLLGYSQSSFTQIIQFADIFGVYGISFVIILINFLLFYWLYNKNKKFLVLAVSISFVLLVYGFIRINQISKINNKDEIKIGVVQPNIAQEKKWRKSLKDEIINTIYTTAQFFKDKNCDVILYPETLLPRMLEQVEEIQTLVKSISEYSDLSLIGGKTVENKNLYNAIFLISQTGNIVDKYKKKHLVLFGEYVPFENFLVKLLEKVNLTDNFAEEVELRVFEFDKYTLGINICSENYYPYLSRELVLKGATLLTTHSNDAWCDGLSYPYQHFVLNIFRAIENRKYLIVASNTGISGVIAPTGKVIKQTKNQEQICFEEIVYANNYITVYDKIGDLFIYLCTVYVILVLLAYGIFRRKKRL
ncbi:MAG: apolipoprotein N-acyltransferase [Elusimicrobia bacterium]|nr:apolipoprotein N-acyltransferase [Elusimicrobiota bacterium]